MNNRICIVGDDWCFGEEFFIQAALFEKTGKADWKIVHLSFGPKENRSDGEKDSYYYAYRIVSIVYEHFCRENEKRIIKNISFIPKFRINANGYSYKDVFERALRAIEQPEEIDLSSENCDDEKLVPLILKKILIG